MRVGLIILIISLFFCACCGKKETVASLQPPLSLRNKVEVKADTTARPHGGLVQKMKKQAKKISGKEEVPFEIILNEVRLEIIPTEVSLSAIRKSWAYLFVVNGLNDILDFGDPFNIQHFKDGQWIYPINPDKPWIAWNAIGRLARPGSCAKMRISYLPDDYLYEVGLYRIEKTVKNRRTKEEYKIYADFIVTD